MDVEDSVMSIKGFKFSLEMPLKIKIRKTPGIGLNGCKKQAGCWHKNAGRLKRKGTYTLGLALM